MEFNFTVEFTFSFNQYSQNLECIFKFHFLFLEIEFNLTEILFCFIMYPDDPCSWKGVHYV